MGSIIEGAEVIEKHAATFSLSLHSITCPFSSMPIIPIFYHARGSRIHNRLHTHHSIHSTSRLTLCVYMQGSYTHGLPTFQYQVVSLVAFFFPFQTSSHSLLYASNSPTVSLSIPAPLTLGSLVPSDGNSWSFSSRWNRRL